MPNKMLASECFGKEQLLVIEGRVWLLLHEGLLSE